MKYLFILTCLFFLTSSQVGQSQVVINEFTFAQGPSSVRVELKNVGNSTINVSSYFLCHDFNYGRVGSMTLICGDFNMQPGEITTVTGFTRISGFDGDLALYRTNDFSNSNAILDYVQWGRASRPRESVAVGAGIWSAGDVAQSIRSISFTGFTLSYDGTGNRSSDWDVLPASICGENDGSTPNDNPPTNDPPTNDPPTNDPPTNDPPNDPPASSGDPEISSLSLINARTEQVVVNQLNNNFQTSLARISILANANSATESVRFVLRNRDTGERVVRNIDNSAPYSLFGDNNGNFLSMNLPNGRYRVNVIPFSQNRGRGTRGDRIRLNFTINRNSLVADTSNLDTTVSIDQDQFSSNSFDIFPNPIDGSEFIIKTDQNIKSNTTVQVITPSGKLIYNKSLSIYDSQHRVNMDGQNLPNGLYLVRITSEGEEPITQKLIKAN